MKNNFVLALLVAVSAGTMLAGGMIQVEEIIERHTVMPDDEVDFRYRSLITKYSINDDQVLTVKISNRELVSLKVRGIEGSVAGQIVVIPVPPVPSSLNISIQNGRLLVVPPVR